MGLLQQAYRTYELMAEKYMGVYDAEQKEPLAPVSHILTGAQIVITLDADGHFITASETDGKKIIIPVTEESAGRTSAPCAHPLCDQLGYLGGHNAAKKELYLTQLNNWAGSQWSHPKVNAVLAYTKNGSILQDLSRLGLIDLNQDGSPEKEKLMVCWRVLENESNLPAECWKDLTLFRSYIDFYAAQRDAKKDLCYISGQKTAPARQHPKGIIAFNGNAKLISANDSSGFTYRGRFFDDTQSAAVGYEVSQKVHAALRWIAVNQGVSFGGRTFICWNPEGALQAKPTASFFRSSAPRVIPSDYREDLKKTLLGRRELLPANAGVVISAFDAATAGRLAITYYNELQASDFLQRLHDWDLTCCWWNGPFGIQSPYLNRIVDCAFGTERKTGLETDDRLMRQQMQRLLASRMDRAAMPTDIVRALVNRASNPTAYSAKTWREIVFTACAAIQKHYHQTHKEDLCMEWSLDRKDRDFQFGRLLAAMDWIEGRYYKEKEEDRKTNAIKSLAAFKRTPWRVFERINTHLESAYLDRLNPKARQYYRKLRDEITAVLLETTANEKELNEPLNEYYLIGYELQRNDFFKKKENASHEADTAENEED